MKTSRRVSAILPVYTLGHPPNLEILNQISKEFKIPLVSDAAAAIGSKYKSEDMLLVKFKILAWAVAFDSP